MFRLRDTNLTRAGPVTNRARPQGHDHHRQFPYVIHLPPAARSADQQLVLGRARQRASRLNTCA